MLKKRGASGAHIGQCVLVVITVRSKRWKHEKDTYSKAYVELESLRLIIQCSQLSYNNSIYSYVNLQL